MEEVKFREINRESYFEYHLPCEQGLLENSLFYKPAKLKEPQLENWLVYLWDSSITYLASGESSLIYSLIVEFFSKDKIIDLVTFVEMYDDKKNFPCKKLNYVKHAFCLEYTWKDNLCRQYGYTTPLEFVSELNYFQKNVAKQKYPIRTLDKQNLSSFIKLYDSPVSLFSFIIHSNSELVSTLDGDEKRPTTEQMLEIADFIVHVQVADDEGYLDYVLIQSKKQIQNEISELEKIINEFGTAYDKLLSDLGTIDEEWKTDLFKTRIKEIFKI